MIQAFRFIEISKYDDGGKLTTLGQLMQGSSSDVYLLLLDASKAFDRVEYVKLSKLLNSKGLCPLVTILLLWLYTKQMLCVKWGHFIAL